MDEPGRRGIGEGDITAAGDGALDDDDAGDGRGAALGEAPADAQAAIGIKGTAHRGITGGDDIDGRWGGGGAQEAAHAEGSLDNQGAGPFDGGGTREGNVRVDADDAVGALGKVDGQIAVGSAGDNGAIGMGLADQGGGIDAGWSDGEVGVIVSERGSGDVPGAGMSNGLTGLGVAGDVERAAGGDALVELHIPWDGEGAVLEKEPMAWRLLTAMLGTLVKIMVPLRVTLPTTWTPPAIVSVPESERPAPTANPGMTTVEMTVMEA